MEKEEKVVEKLKAVMDPHTGLDVYTMGLITNLKVEPEKVSLTFTPTSPFCPMGIQLAVAIKSAVAQVEGVTNVDINVQGHMNSAEINEMLKKQK
ncbi:MAG: metal-sulfur cluster assembly factor [Methanobacteriota archaeon]